MKLFGNCVIILICSLCYHAVETEKLTCQVQALKWTPMLKSEMNGSIFWTKLFINPEPSDKTPPIGFMRNHDLVRTHLTFDAEVLISNSYVTAGDNMVQLFESKYVVDHGSTIFESKEYIRKRSVFKLCPNGVEYSKITSVIQPVVRFALVYVEANGQFRIYQTCDGQVLWVQISDQVNQYDLMEGLLFLNRYSEEITQVVDGKIGLNVADFQYIPYHQFPFDFVYTYFDKFK